MWCGPNFLTRWELGPATNPRHFPSDASRAASVEMPAARPHLNPAEAIID
jgi:hypothetical protein